MWRQAVLSVLYVLSVVFSAAATPVPRRRPALGVGGMTHQPVPKAGRLTGGNRRPDRHHQRRFSAGNRRPTGRNGGNRRPHL